MPKPVGPRNELKRTIKCIKTMKLLVKLSLPVGGYFNRTVSAPMTASVLIFLADEASDEAYKERD